MNANDILIIRNLPLFQSLPQEVLDQLIPIFEELHYHFGQIVVKEGENADAFYIITAGKARVLTSTDGGREVALQTLSTGHFFGEMGLLDKGIRTNTVRASSDLTVLRLADSDFKHVIQQFPAIQSSLAATINHRKIHNFLRQFSELGKLSQPALNAVSEALSFSEFKAGQHIITEGDEGGPLFIINQGRCRAYRHENGQENNLAYLRSGDYFGELSFVKHTKRTAHVMATTDCTLLTLNHQGLAKLTENFPELNKLLNNHIELHYEQSNHLRLPLDFAPMITITDTGNFPAQPMTPPAASSPQSPSSSMPPPSKWRSLSFLNRGNNLFIQQIDEADCGAAALGMICRYYGSLVSLSEVRRLAHTTVEGTSLQDLCFAAQKIGFRPQSWKIDKNALEKLTAPAIIHWQNDHWIVLLDRRKQQFQIADPATKISWIDEEHFKENWSGYALLFTPPEIVPAPSKQAHLLPWMRSVIKPFRMTLILTLFLTTIISGLQLAFPVLTQYIVDHVIMLNDPQNLNVLVASLGIVLIMTMLITIVQRRSLSYASARLDGVILEFLMNKMMSLPLKYYLIRSADDIQRRLEGASEIRHFLSSSAISGISGCIQLLANLCLMALYNLRMTQIFLVLVPIYVGLMYFSARILKPAFDDLAENDVRYKELQNEVIKGMQTVKAAGAERSFNSIIMQGFARLAQSKSKSNFNIYCYDGTIQALGFLSTILFLWIGAQLVLHQRMSMGEFIAFQMLTAMSYNPLINILNTWENLQYTAVLFNRINDVIEHPSEQSDIPGKKRIVTTLQGKIELRGVNLSYSNSPNSVILRHINLTISPGQFVGIVGRKDSGKSLLAKNLATLLEPMTGAIYYDDLDVRTLDLSSLRRFIGLVVKDDHVFSRLSIQDNIAFGDPNPRMEQVIKATKIAAIHDVIMQLPKGYQTGLAELHSLWSPNYRQQLAIARAIYRDPSILILDDALHDFDRSEEQFIIRGLDNFRENRTLIMATNHLSSIQHADLILVLDHGQISESGTHEELLNKKGLYYQLWHS